MWRRDGRLTNWRRPANRRRSVDRDLRGAHAAALGQLERQDAIVELRRRAILIELDRQHKAARIARFGAFADQHAVALLALVGFARLRLNLHATALDRYLDVALGHARQI